MSILKSGTIWVNIDEHEQGQHRVRKVERHGICLRFRRGLLVRSSLARKDVTGLGKCSTHRRVGKGGAVLLLQARDRKCAL